MNEEVRRALIEAADYLDGEFADIRRAQGKSWEWLAGIADAEQALREMAAKRLET